MDVQVARVASDIVDAKRFVHLRGRSDQTGSELSISRTPTTLLWLTRGTASSDRVFLTASIYRGYFRTSSTTTVVRSIAAVPVTPSPSLMRKFLTTSGGCPIAKRRKSSSYS